MATTETKKCHKVNKVLVDSHVEAYMPYQECQGGTQEQKAKYLVEAVKEFDTFLRDHRSQDMIKLNVKCDYKDQCSACGNRWDIFKDDDEKWKCGNCGIIVEDE